MLACCEGVCDLVLFPCLWWIYNSLQVTILIESIALEKVQNSSLGPRGKLFYPPALLQILMNTSSSAKAGFCIFGSQTPVCIIFRQQHFTLFNISRCAICRLITSIWLQQKGKWAMLKTYSTSLSNWPRGHFCKINAQSRCNFVGFSFKQFIYNWQ